MRPTLALLLLVGLTAPLSAQAGQGMAMDQGKMMDHAMPSMTFTAVAPHTASGSYQMVVKDNKHWLTISDDFKSTNAPDGFVYLAKDGKVDANALELGQLAGGQGGGSFAVPVDAKVWDYNTVVVWSKAHHAAVATAPLHAMKHDGMMKHDGKMRSHDTGMMKKGDGMMKHDTGMMQKP
ncbi:MAG: DM13 domain-containing protein [Gemmatimonadales bacterium]